MTDRRLPDFADAKVVESWSELITASPDWHQLIGTPDGWNNFYVVAGVEDMDSKKHRALRNQSLNRS